MLSYLYGHEVGLHLPKLVDVDAGEEDAEDEHAQRHEVAARHQPVHDGMAHGLFHSLSPNPNSTAFHNIIQLSTQVLDSHVTLSNWAMVHLK